MTRQNLTDCSDFNPRSRVGSDAETGGSRHVPDNFNPRSRVGSDLAKPRRDNNDEAISIHAPV